MSKKTKRHVKKVSGEKKVPRISIMEQQKKRRSKLYTYISVAVGIIVLGAIILGAIVSGNPAKPASELVDGHFAQKEGFFEMDTPNGWKMLTSFVDTAPYGLEKCQYPYLFIPEESAKPEEKAEGSETTIAKISPNNILCAVFTPGSDIKDIENFLTGQNILDEPDLVAYFQTKGKLAGTRLEKANAWIIGDKPVKGLTSGSLLAYVEGDGFSAYIHGKYADEANKELILKSLRSITTKAVEPAVLKEYKDQFGYVNVPTPEGWTCDTTGDVLSMHMVLRNYGAMFYPSGTRNKLELTADQVQAELEKSEKKPEGKVTGGLSFSMPLKDYLSVYVIDPKTNPEAFDDALAKFIGFGLNDIADPYKWIQENVNKKGQSMANCPGKYFIYDPIQIMNVKPEKNLFGIIEAKDGKVVLMGGWSNEGVQKIIIDTINKITSAPKGK